MKGQKGIGVLIVLALACLGAALPAAAQSDNKASRWTFEVVPVFWASGLDITALTGTDAQTINVSFSDILKALHFGMVGSFEARKGRFGILFDGMYVDLGKSIPQTGTMPGDVRLDLQQSGLSLALAYRMTGQDATTFDLLGGARYNYMNSALKVTSGPLTGLENTSKDSWVDGFVGLRVLGRLAHAWTLLAYGDVGAGGSKLTYQGKIGVIWAFSRVVSAQLGYRHQYFERVTDEQGDSFKMAKSGFYVGLGFRF